jgi:hypothetical protein
MIFVFTPHTAQADANSYQQIVSQGTFTCMLQSNLKVAEKSLSTNGIWNTRQLFDKQLISYFEAYM